MTSRKPPRKLAELLRRYDPAVKSLAYALRTVILDEIAPCHERMFAQKNKVVMLFAATDHVIEDCICQIHVFVKYVQLAFPRVPGGEEPLRPVERVRALPSGTSGGHSGALTGLAGDRI